MAALSGAATRYDMKGLREALSDKIYDISPMQTPFITGAGRGPKATSTTVEWQTDELAAADGTNAVVEGNQTTHSTPAATVRVGNITQISEKEVAISGTLEAVDKAGRKSELAYQLTKRGRELKRDQETILLRAQAGNSGGSSTARTLASMNAWLKSNVDKHATGGNPTYTSGVPAAVRTDGTQRAFTETLLKNAMQLGYTNGASFSTLMVGPVNKQVVSGFSGIVTRNYDLSNVSPKATAVIASIDVYVGDFHTVRVVPNRFQRDRDAWLLDWEYVSVRYLRPHATTKLGRTGDSERRLMNCEYTLQVSEEQALGLVADLTV